MKKAIKISVVIPTYNRALLLKRCIDSIARQDFDATEYEIIIVCDGYDKGAEIITNECAGKYPNHRFRLTNTVKKSGPASARNLGWYLATGKLIVFTDDDCYAGQLWLKNLWRAYLLRQSDIIAFTGSVFVPLPQSPTDFEKNLSNIQHGEFVTANCACSKKALQLVNGFDEAFTMAWREDSDLHFKFLAAAIPIEKVSAAVIIHPVRNARWGVSLYEQKKTMYNVLLYKKFPSFYRKRIRYKPKWSYYIIILSFITAVVSFATGLWVTALPATIIWTWLTGRFFLKRMKGTSKKAAHVLEMAITSLCIPFLSVYWGLYGSLRFKKLLL